MQMVLAWAKSARVLESKGAKVKMAHWWSLLDRLGEAREGIMASAVAPLRMEKGIFRDMTELRGALQAHVLQEPQACQEVPGLQGSIAGGGCHNGTPTEVRLGESVMLLCEAVRHASGVFLTQQKTRWGTSTLLAGYAAGEWEEDVTRVATTLLDEPTMRKKKGWLRGRVMMSCLMLMTS